MDFKFIFLTICFILTLSKNKVSAGILYPRVSESREIVSLDGLWDFTLSDPNNPQQGHNEKWYQRDLRDIDISIQSMAVPSSYNDISTDYTLRDHFGLVWYQRKFYVPAAWDGQKVWIRFSSVTREAEVWVNGQSVIKHSIGHLPFQADVSEFLNYGIENTVTVSVDNTLTQTTVPQGGSSTLSSGRRIVTYNFEYFNYAGIDRPVVLYTTPATAYIDDITVTTGISGTTGTVNFDVTVQGTSASSTVRLLDKSGAVVATSAQTSGTLNVPNANFWWPYLMDPNPGYLYSLEVQILDANSNIIDRYVQQIGIRTLSWDADTFNINGNPIYFRGFAKHEDSDFRGAGLDLSVIVRDLELLQWVGANSFKASNYPYAEEILDLADRYGIMIIDESPAVNINTFSDELLANHKQSLTELIQRDKNRPSVILWSASKDADAANANAGPYFQQITDHIRSLDITRPLTVASNLQADQDNVAQYIDIATVNTNDGWTINTGDLDVITYDIGDLLRGWKNQFNIPVVITQYGAEAQEGLHILPSFVWSEEYQEDLLSHYFELFDQLRSEGVIIGEMILNFSDFKTKQDFLTVGGNKKGIFSRNRQPKSSAQFVRQRYWSLAEIIDKAAKPKNLRKYVAPRARDEL